MKQVSALSDEQIAVGAALARAREDAGMTTTQVSEATRVRRGIIEAIERGNFSIPGGEVYARGHIRAIAAVLGIDAAPLLAQLDVPVVAQPGEPSPAPPGARSPAPPGARSAAQSGGRSVQSGERSADQPGARSGGPAPAQGESSALSAVSPARHASVPPVPQPTAVGDRRATLGGSLASTLGARATRSGPNWSGVMVAALALVIVVGAVQLYRGSSSGQHPLAVPSVSPSAVISSPPVVVPSPPATSSSPSAPPVSPPASDPPVSPPSSVVAQGDAVTVVLTVTGRACWMRVTTATQTLFEGTLTRGATQTFQDKSKVKLLLGNAGGVSLVVNGVDVGHPGGAGQVTTVVFGPGNPTLGQA